MRPSRREFVKWVTASGIALSLSRLAVGAGAALRRARDAARAGELESGGEWRRPHRRRRQGHRREALRLRFSRRRPAGLAGEDLARHARPRAGCHARLYRPRSRAPRRRAQAVGGGDRRRSRQDRRPRSRILCRRSVLPGRQDAALSGPAGRAADLRDVRCLRSGAARAARRHVRASSARRPAPSCVPNYGAFRFTRVAGATPDAPDVYSPIQAGWVSPGRFQNSALPVWSPLAKETPAPYAKAATYGEQIRAELAADDPALLVLDREFETQSVDPMFLEPECGLAWYDEKGDKLELVLGVQSPYEAAEVDRASCSARPARRSSRRASTRSSPMSAAASAAAITRRSCSMSRWRRCSSPAGRCGSRMTATSSSRRGIKRHAFKMRSRIGVDRATGKIRAFAADHVLDGGGLANFSASVATCRRDRRDRHLRHSEGRRHHRRAALARRDRGLDARLRHAADHDGAGGADRRGGGRAAARSDRIPAAQCAASRAAGP